MGHSKRKKYIPNPKFNPVVMNKRLEKLEKDLTHHRNLLLSVNKANDLHVEQLSNFVRHDMKNAIQGIDGTLYNAKASNLIPEDVQNQLDTALSLLRGTLDNFTRLIPSSKNTTTTLPEVFNAVELLSRGELQNRHINAIFDYDRKSCCVISYPFQSLVQILHNLVINSYNALTTVEDKKIMIKADIEPNRCVILIYDNGIAIDPDKRDVIFDYGYSTTGGSGIGLFHAKSIVEEMGGNIRIQDSDKTDYTKCFSIEFNPQKEIL